MNVPSIIKLSPSLFRSATSSKKKTSDANSSSNTTSTKKDNMARTKQTARRTTGYAATNGHANGTSTPAPDPRGPAGTKSEWKRIDEVYDSKLGRWIFRDSAPFTGDETDDAYRDYCFVLKKKYEYNSSRSTTSVVIKSEALKDVCTKVIGEIPPVVWHSPEVDISPRVLLTFLPMLEQQLTVMKEKEEEGDLADLAAVQLGILVDFLRSEYASDIKRLDSLLSHGEITFDTLWAILIPNKEYYTTDPRTGQARAVILKWATQQCSQSGPYFDLDCEYLESYGNSPRNRKQGVKESDRKFGRATFSSIIWGFQGAVKIHNLNIFPMEYHPRMDDVRAQLIARGKKWAAYDGMHHVAYTGIAFQNEPYGGKKRIYINGRAMVDKATFRRIKSNWAGMGLPKAVSNNYDYDSDDEYDSGLNSTDNSKRYRIDPDHLNDSDYVLATPIVYGFALDDKQWVEFNIDLVEEIVWNDTAFKNLVLPPEKKSLIQALVEAHNSKDRLGFDDFIVGKGQGLVINLFGPPGVGKTMSAEATSEHLRKPLYVVGAGDLGTHADALDKALNEIFDIAHSWNAVVLIDEADVFLEERSVHDIQRNALVAVFLRQLEYFAGILFLTTNRVSTFDDAFQSRIHVALRYRELDQQTRSAIWKAFLSKVNALDGIGEKEWERLVAQEVNGRQIKNAVRTAQALAHSKKESLTFAHIDLVLNVMEQFENDMKSIKA